MKLFSRLSLFIAGLIAVGAVKDFFNKYDVLVFDKNDVDEARREQEDNTLDLRGNPTHECICGSQAFYVKAVFDNYEIATYYLDMQCVECGSLATAPTPLDRESQE